MHPNIKPSAIGVELRHIDPARGLARRYHLAQCPSLFGELALMISWGRIGTPTRVRVETFPDASALDARWQQLLARRSSHGYALT